MITTTRRNPWTLVGGLLVTVGLYVLLFWLPHRRYITRMKGEIAARRAAIDTQRGRLSRLVSLHNDLDVLENFHREMTARIPATLNLREFHAAVHTICENRGVTLSSDTPQIATELVGFQKQPAIITLTGRFHGVVQALYELETMSPLVEITDLDLKPTTKPGEPSETLEVRLDLKLFAAPAKPAAPAKNND